MGNARAWVEQIFTHVDESFVVTSPRDCYNCISHALGESEGMIWPSQADGNWPADIEFTEHISSFSEMFRRHGYQQCETSAIDPGYEKIAVYSRDGFVKHAARQLASGWWSSKLGWTGYDIAHHSLTDLEGRRYGFARHFFRRAVPGTS